MRYLLLLILFVASCNSGRNSKLKKLSKNAALALNLAEKKNIDSLLSVAVHSQCVYTGTSGLGGNYTEEYRAYETIDKLLKNEELYALLKNENPKVRFLAIEILRDRDDMKLFKEGTKLLANDTSIVCFASGCLVTELPLNMHIKYLSKQKD